MLQRRAWLAPRIRSAVHGIAALAAQRAAWPCLCLEAWLMAARAERRRQANGDAPSSSSSSSGGGTPDLAALSSALAALQAAATLAPVAALGGADAQKRLAALALQ